MMVIQLVEEDSLRRRLITGTHVGEKVYIPRIIMSPVESAWPFLLNRRQYHYLVLLDMHRGKRTNIVNAGPSPEKRSRRH
jgi:ATP-dependent DNA helicase PIF1